MLSQDVLFAEDLASQQGATAPVAIDFSLFLEFWQEEVLASVNSLLAAQLGGVSNSVPSIVTNPPASSSALILGPSPDAVQCLPPRVLMQKGVCSHIRAKGGCPETRGAF